VAIKSLFNSVLGGMVCGMTIAAAEHYREEKAGEPSVLDKAKAWERKVFEDGEARAMQLAELKQEAKLRAKLDDTEKS
jgi:protein involved in sex pheromone biosynthesis